MHPPLPISALIRIRTSRRTYLTNPLEEEILNGIKSRISSISPGPMGTDINFSLIGILDVSNKKLKLGTYGFIQGARYFIAGQVIPSKQAFLDYGYTLEKLILEFTGMGLGTCWLGGTFNRGEFAKAMILKENHVIPAISPVGYATSSRGIGERLIRLGAGSRNRLPPDRVFFDKETASPLALQEDHPFMPVLESVRFAPSASNHQPWRIVAERNQFHFYLSRRPGYHKAFSGIDLQMIDIGIAMSHFDLVAKENGQDPVWEISAGMEPFEGSEYVISVFLP